MTTIEDGTQWRRKWGWTWARWGIGLVAGTILITSVPFWMEQAGAIGGESADGVSSSIGAFVVGFYVYIFFFALWVDYLLAKRGKWGAMLGHTLAGALGSVAIFLIGDVPEPLVFFGALVAISVALNLLAGLIPKSFAPRAG